jgi:hypothetical protein
MNKKKYSTKIALFRGKKIRKTIFNNEWWFVAADIILALTDTSNVKDYIRKMRIRDKELGKGWGQFVTPLSIPTEGGQQLLKRILRNQRIETFCRNKSLQPSGFTFRYAVAERQQGKKLYYN